MGQSVAQEEAEMQGQIFDQAMGPDMKEAHSKEDKMREAVMAKYKNVDYKAELSAEERNDIKEKVIRAMAENRLNDINQKLRKIEQENLEK